MKTIGWLIVAMLTAGSAFAEPERGFIEATGGLQGSSAAVFTGWMSSGAAGTQIGVRVAPHLFAIGEFGKFKSLQPVDVQPAVDSTVSSLAALQGLDVTGQAELRASYGFGGVRLQGATAHHIAPYAMGGLGGAHLTPSATFLYTDGLLPGSDGTTPAPDAGTDVTNQITAAGAFTPPATSSSLMLAAGAGATIDIARHLTADVGYRLSSIRTDTPITSQGVSFGVGVRF